MKNNSYTTRTFVRWMRITGLFLLFFAFSAMNSMAQNVTVAGGTAAAGSYATLNAALTAVNATTATGAITITINAGYSETAPATGFTIGSATLNPTLNSTNTLTLTKSGGTVTLNAGVGTATPASAAPDGILKIVGANYVTVNGLNLIDGNTTNPATMEFGIAFFKLSATDGAQNNTIQNCVISMQRVNNASGSGAMVEGSVGILSVNSVATAATTALTPSSAAGTNSNNKFYANSINGGNYGIVLNGYAAPSPFTLGDTGNDIGGVSGSTGNFIANYGGGAATNPAAGIRANNQWSLNISYNNVNNNNGSGVNHATTLRGIYGQAGTSANVTISNNTVTINGGATTSSITAIDNSIGSTAASNTVDILNNIIQNCTYSTSTSGTFTGINNGSSATTVNINGNQILNNVIAGTGTNLMIECGSPLNANINNNTISGNHRPGLSGIQRCIKMTSPTNLTISGNTIENNNWTNLSSTGSTDGVYGFSSSVNVTITGNIIRYLSTPTTGTLTGIREFGVSGTKIIQNNEIYGFSTTAGGVGGESMFGISCSTGNIEISNNQVYALNSTGTTGGTSGTIAGIQVSGGTTNTIFKNRVCDLSSASSNPLVVGINLTGSTTATTSNNRISDLRATAANAANPLIGINISGGTTHLLYYNTVYINGSSSGALFGSSAISASTSPALTLNSNIFVNTSTTNGAGIAAAYRRSGTTLTSYNSSSNYNLFYAGAPGPNRLIFYDGTNSDQTIIAYKARVTTRDAASITEMPTFVATACGDPDFLRIDTSIPTGIESGGATIAGITDDFQGDIRFGNVGYGGSGTAADMGADEFDGIPLPLCTGMPTSSNVTGAAAVCTNTGTTLGLDVAYTEIGITFQWGSSTSSGGPYTNLGTNSTQNTGVLTSTTYYVCTVTCTLTGDSYTTPEFEVLVNGLPTVGVSPTSGTVCSPGGTPVALTGSGATSYAWSPATGLNAVTGTTVNALPGANTTYTVTGTDGNGCTATATATIAVNPAVSVSALIATPNPICSGASSQLSVSAGTTTSYAVASKTYGLISGSGTTAVTGDDAAGSAITIPFTFSFFGTGYSSIYVHSNGFASFSSGQPAGSPYNETVPTASTPNNYVAICHDDLNIIGGGAVTYFTSGVSPNRVFVIDWSAVKFYNSAANNGDLSGQIQLFEKDNHIEVHVTNNTDPTASAHTLGIENAAGTLGYAAPGRNNVTYSFSTPEAWAFYPNGGTLTYLWTAPTNLNNPAIANPIAGPLTADETFTVTVTDASGCAGTGTVSVNVGATLTTTSTTSSASVCAGQSVTLTAVPVGGGAPYTYNWSDGISSVGTTSPLSLVPPTGTTVYTLTVTDACTGTASSTVSVTSNALPTVSITPPSASICGPGTVALTASGATTYAWSPAAGLNATTGASVNASVTGSTSYSVTGTDGNGCTATSSVAITVNPVVSSVSASVSASPVCEGSNVNLSSNGVISGYTMNPACGTGFVDISVSGTSVGAISDDSEHNITLPFTFYFNGTPYTTARIGNNGLLVFGSTAGDIYYSNTCLPQNGTISSTSGLGNAGSQAIAALWDDLTPGTGASITTQQIGSVFYIQWTNEDNFNATGSGTVTFQIQLEQTTNIITLSYLDVIYGAAGYDNGQSATVGLNLDPSNANSYSCNTASVSNGQCISFTPVTLSYAWTGPNGFNSPNQNETITSVTPLASGTYTVTATSAAGCSNSNTVSLVVDPTVTASASVNNHVSCNGGSNGSATATAGGGAGSPTYSWAPSGGSAATASGLAAGTYTVTITDGTCSATATVTITEPATLVASCSVLTNVSCNGGTDGSALVSASGGTSPYTGTGTFTGLAAGTYTYNISDDNGCTASCSVTITEPAVLVATCSVISNVSCNGGSDGSASVSASGGTSGYTGTGTFSGLTAGTYTYNISDANGCTASCSVTITEPAVLSLVCTPTNESFPGANDGSVNVVASGGTTPYSGDGLFSGLAAGTYSYTVTDNNGCTASCTSTVGTNCVPSTPATSASTSATEICSGNNVTLSLTGGSLGTGASWKWYEGGCGAGAVIGTGTSFTTGAITGAGVHTFYARAEGLCGTTTCVSVSVTVTAAPPSGSIAVVSFPASGCVGGSGSITCTSVPGATGYSWSGPAGILFDGQPSPYVSTSTTVTLTYTALPPAGISGWNVCVFAKNACGNSPNTKCSWIRATVSTPNYTSAAAIACPGSTGIYTVAAVDGATTYNWSITGGNASLNGAGASVTTAVPIVNVAFGAGFTGGTLCVSATTACGYTGGSRCVTITTAPLLPAAIIGSSTICPGSSSGYSIPAVAGAASYIWTATGTGVTVVGSGTSATVSTTGAFVSGSVCVVAVSSCGSPLGNSAQRCKTIGTGKLGTPGNITGDPTTGVCGQTYTYSIPSMAGATGGYTWTLPPGATGFSTSNSITVTFPGAFTSGTICVHGNNACGAGPDRCVNVFGNPGTPSSLSGNATPCIAFDEVYTWPAVPGATQYQLVVPSGYTVISGNPTISNFAIINIGGTAGSIGVKAENTCGVSGTRTLALAPVSCRLAGNQPEVVKALATQVYPNPTTGLLNVQFNSAANDQSYVINVLDLSGRVVLATEGKANEGSNLQVLDLTHLAKGMYMISLQTNEGNQLVRVSVE